MCAMGDTRLYTIGELARRTGLPVKTIRFYSDAGVLPPTDRTTAGYRLYDLQSVSRLELIRTLRDLGAGLGEIKNVLSSKTSLQELATAQLTLLDQQIRLLHTRRAVLRAVVHQDSPTERIRLMTKITKMSEEERNRLIDTFWQDVAEELDLSQEWADAMRSPKPELPEAPTSAQVEAWIEIAEMLQDPSFRHAVCQSRKAREELRRNGTFDTAPTPEEAGATEALLGEVEQAYQVGEDPASQRARTLADAYAGLCAARLETADTPDFRRRQADRMANTLRWSHYRMLHLTLIGADPRPARHAEPMHWLVAALRAS